MSKTSTTIQSARRRGTRLGGRTREPRQTVLAERGLPVGAPAALNEIVFRVLELRVLELAIHEVKPAAVSWSVALARSWFTLRWGDRCTLIGLKMGSAFTAARLGANSSRFALEVGDLNSNMKDLVAPARAMAAWLKQRRDTASASLSLTYISIETEDRVAAVVDSIRALTEQWTAEEDRRQLRKKSRGDLAKAESRRSQAALLRAAVQEITQEKPTSARVALAAIALGIDPPTESAEKFSGRVKNWDRLTSPAK